MRTYLSLIDGLSNLLNHKGRSLKGANSQEEFKTLLSELKQNYKIEISKKFLFNLFNVETTLKQKRQKIRNLLRGIETEKEFTYKRTLDFMQYTTLIKDFGFKKGYTLPDNHKKNVGFICDAKGIYCNIRAEKIGKEFINNQRETLTIIKI